MRVVLVSRARAEFVEVQLWYIERAGLHKAECFVAEFERVLAALEQNPKLWAEYEPGIRRALFRDFPYAMHYMLRDDHVLVLALSHQHRRPGYWRGRIPK